MSRSVLFIVDSLCSLDDSLQLRLLVAELARAGDRDVHVAITDPACGTGNTLAGVEVKTHYLMHAAASQSAASDGRKLSTMFVAARNLKHLLDHVRPDVVHTWGLVAQRCMGVTQLISKSANSSLRWFSTIISRPEKSGFLAGQADRRFCRQIEKVFVPHQVLRESMLETGFTEGQITELPNSAATLSGRPSAREKLLARIGLTGESVVVAGTAGHLVPVTRRKDLIWATDLLNCIRADFHLVLFGRGHQRENLERFASFTEAASHVHFLPPAEAESLLGGLDVYWHSHLQHPLPSALLCAMASAVPVISVYGPGTEEIILHQQTGFAVNYGARDEFARWTKFLIEKPDAARQLAEQGRSHVLKKFPAAEMVAEYQSAISKGQ